MAAYVIANIDITDPGAYEEYRQKVPATIAKYGGRYIARGGRLEPLVKIRQKASRGKLVIVEGV